MVTLVCIQLRKIASGNGNFKEKHSHPIGKEKVER